MKRKHYTFDDLVSVEHTRLNKLLENAHNALFFNNEYKALLMKYDQPKVNGKYVLSIDDYIDAISEILNTDSTKLSDRIIFSDITDSVIGSELCNIYLYQYNPNAVLLNKIQFLLHIATFYFDRMDGSNKTNCIVSHNDLSNKYIQIFENDINNIIDISDIDMNSISNETEFRSDDIVFAIDCDKRVSIIIIDEYGKVSRVLIINTRMFAICSSMQEENKGKFGPTLIMLDKILYSQFTPKLRINPFNEEGKIATHPYDNNMSTKPLYSNNFKLFTSESYTGPDIPLNIMDTINESIDNDEDVYGIYELPIGKCIEIGYILEKMKNNFDNNYYYFLGYTLYMNTKVTWFRGNEYSQLTVNDISAQFVSMCDIQAAMVDMGERDAFAVSIYKTRDYSAYHFGTDDSLISFEKYRNWHLEKKIEDVDKFTVAVSRRDKNSPLYWFHVLIASSYNKGNAAILSLPYNLGYAVLTEKDDESNILSFTIMAKGIDIPISPEVL